jgi:predicted dehydrogenase
VLVEKPMATRLHEAEELCAVAAETGRTLAVGLRPGHRWMHDAIQDGLVGRVCLVRVQRFWPFPSFPQMPPDPALSWRTSLEESRGWVLNDIGAHLLDLATWLVGSPTRLAFSRTANFRFEETEAEDTAVLVLDAEDGAAVVIETSHAMSSFPGTVEVHGTEGWMRGDGTFDGDGVVVTHRGDRNAFSGVTADEVYLASFRDFLGAIHGEPMAGATAADGAANVAIVEAAARA